MQQRLNFCQSVWNAKNKAIILIDEYDVPLENAWFEGFYNEMVAFIRSLFESALKTNSHLASASSKGMYGKESIII